MTDVPPEGSGPPTASPPPSDAQSSAQSVTPGPQAESPSPAQPQYASQPQYAAQAQVATPPAYPAQGAYPAQPEYPTQQPYPPQQPYPAPPYPAQPAFAAPAGAAPVAVPARRPFDRAKWVPTLAVAAIIAAVVGGGLGLDSVIPIPSLGSIDVGNGVQVSASPGWAKSDTSGDTSGMILLTKGDAVLLIGTVPDYRGDPKSLLETFVQNSEQQTSPGDGQDGVGNSQITFGQIEEGTLGGDDAAAVAFTGITQNGPFDGEEIIVVHNGVAVTFQAMAPQGDLQAVGEEVKDMASSLSEAS